MKINRLLKFSDYMTEGAVVSDSSSEEKSPLDIKKDSKVKYKTKDGGEAEGTVKEVSGDEVTIYNDNIKKDIKKTKSEIIGMVGEESTEEPAEESAETTPTTESKRVLSFVNFKS